MCREASVAVVILCALTVAAGGGRASCSSCSARSGRSPTTCFGGVGGAAFLLLALAYAAVGATDRGRACRATASAGCSPLLGLLIALNVLTYAYAAHGVHATRDLSRV